MIKKHLLIVEIFVIVLFLAYIIYEGINVIDSWKDYNDIMRYSNMLGDTVKSLKSACVNKTINWLVISIVLDILSFIIHNVRTNRKALIDIIEVLENKEILEEYQEKDEVEKNIKICPYCGYQIFPDEDSCSNCGKTYKRKK